MNTTDWKAPGCGATVKELRQHFNERLEALAFLSRFGSEERTALGIVRPGESPTDYDVHRLTAGPIFERPAPLEHEAIENLEGGF